MPHMVCLQMEVEGTIGTHATYITWSVFTPTLGRGTFCFFHVHGLFIVWGSNVRRICRCFVSLHVWLHDIFF